jgi:hypothetical protein
VKSVVAFSSGSNTGSNTLGCQPEGAVFESTKNHLPSKASNDQGHATKHSEIVHAKESSSPRTNKNARICMALLRLLRQRSHEV